MRDLLSFQGGRGLTVQVRISDLDDLAAVDAILARSYPKLLRPDYPPSVLVTALPLISRAQPGLLSSGTYFVAVQSGSIVGAGGWTRDRARADLGHVRHVITDDKKVRSGVGRAVLDKVLAQARSFGIEELECWSTLTAEPFYRAMGFVTEGPMEVALQPGISFPAIRMRHSLK